MRAVPEADVERAWAALRASGRDPEAWMLMYADAGRWVFKHAETRRSVFVGDALAGGAS